LTVKCTVLVLIPKIRRYVAQHACADKQIEEGGIES
jgi:hypothetical protein